MGLKFPEDLEAWQKWQLTSKPERRAKEMLKALHNVLPAASGGSRNTETVQPLAGALHTRGQNPQVLVALDSTSPTSLNSLVRPLEYLAHLPLAVWAPEDLTAHLPGEGWARKTLVESELNTELPNLKLAVALGHYMAWGSSAYRLAQRAGARFVTVQHGLHTPYAPPLAHGTHLLAFSQKDAEFWISGRADVTHDVVGSQLFWEAAQKPVTELEDTPLPPVFLGQMHGAELPRASLMRASIKFTRDKGAIYRPHPSEKDKLSRLTHGLMGKLGIEIDRSQQPLNQVNNPVVSIFSTGVLEAALRGVPAWVYHPNPPAWVTEFWQRYGMNQWGSEPTPAPQLPDREPAQQIAERLTQLLEN
ncbi:RNA-binding protein [Rothia nasimurium]|uniref:RNA-binding protein n=1 Tax=Rothia nasimurium TaxID=85336 RepID=A0A1Y1RLW5_9MICC|nr:RNA-binding protein [Rothia nasimurium]ORC15450.1 RNA-binding protein [Rothia nasimurium]